MDYLLTALVQTDVSVGALALSGYPPEDLVLKTHFMADCRRALDTLRRELPREALVVVGTPLREGRQNFNAAAIFAGGRLLGFYRKMLLPNYGVFDEQRVFTPGDRPLVLAARGLRIGVHICEDSWAVEEAPCRALRAARVDVAVNLSASPYHRGKLRQRQQVMGRAAKYLGSPLLYCNLVGGQDELVFDGASMVFNARGGLEGRARQFEDDVLYHQVPVPGNRPRKTSNPWKIQTLKVPVPGKIPAGFSRDWKNRKEAPLDDLAEVYAALKRGLRDYVDKNGFSHVIVAVSGGIDSALVATIAVDALGADRVAAVTMPSRFSSPATLSDAEQLARLLDIKLSRVPIERLHALYLEELAPLWPGRHADITEENIQARIRGNIVMALSNKFGWLVLTTGNKSELATGYCTLYGDMAGGFSVIKDVPKTLVFELARWRNRQAGRELIPQSTIDRPPSAELRPDQKDQDSLPPYDVLDRILERYVEQDASFDDLVAGGFDPAVVKSVIRMIDRAEYKRRQGAPGVKITPKAFGRDRRLPITNLYDERARAKD
jgi:NAD+ synthase (glutamine-hydrolysing)